MKKEKENKQKEFNLEAEINILEQKLLDGIDGMIIDVSDMTNEEFFNMESYEKRNGIAITIKLDNGEEISQWFNREVDVRGYQQSNIYLFKKAYGSVPKAGLKIKAVLIDGFFKIKL